MKVTQCATFGRGARPMPGPWTKQGNVRGGSPRDWTLWVLDLACAAQAEFPCSSLYGMQYDSVREQGSASQAWVFSAPVRCMLPPSPPVRAPKHWRHALPRKAREGHDAGACPRAPVAKLVQGGQGRSGNAVLGRRRGFLALIRARAARGAAPKPGLFCAPPQGP